VLAAYPGIREAASGRQAAPGVGEVPVATWWPKGSSTRRRSSPLQGAARRVQGAEDLP